MENSIRNKSKIFEEQSEIKEPFYHDELVDVYDLFFKSSSEAMITSIRGDIYRVKYTDSDQEETIRSDDTKIILKQWRPGRNLMKFNRVDVRSTRDNCYYLGLVTFVDKEKFKVLYPIRGELIEETFPISTNRISEIGKYTQNRFTNQFCNSEEINSYLYKKKKLFKPTNNQEQGFREELKKIRMKIIDIKEDGNCMYRAVAHQLYGDEEFYDVVKNYCMDYLEIERDFFGQFINGGVAKFSEYLELKRKEGVWGDDIELQAISELYDRPIEIYSYSIEPLKTFHENSNFNRFGSRSEQAENKQALNKIMITYHGSSHYNSLVYFDETLFKKILLKSKPGILEKNAIENIKKLKADLLATSQRPEAERAEKTSIPPTAFSDNLIIDSSNKAGSSDKKIGNSREDFMNRREKDIDSLIEERMIEISKKRNEILETNKNNLETAITQSEQLMTEEELLKSVIEMSKKEANIGNNIYIQNNSNNTNNSKNLNVQNDQDAISPSVRFIIDMGFTFEEAIMALSVVGDDPELMLNYLYSVNHD